MIVTLRSQPRVKMALMNYLEQYLSLYQLLIEYMIRFGSNELLKLKPKTETWKF